MFDDVKDHWADRRADLSYMIAPEENIGLEKWNTELAQFIRTYAQSMVEEAKTRAVEEGAKIIASAKAEDEQESVKARESLRDQVAALAVKGAEQILRKEVNAGVHADLLAQLKTEL